MPTYLPPVFPSHGRIMDGWPPWAALEMIDYLRDRNQRSLHQWQVRIGLHSGPVVGGIVGAKKNSTISSATQVNIAARLQSLAEPMRINLSRAFCQGLGPEFILSSPWMWI